MMLRAASAPGAPIGRRRSLRRAIHVETELWCALWEGGVPFVATNMSVHGVWLESDLALSVGDSVGLVFTPPRWGRLPKLCVRATVARVDLRRRRRDRGAAGMGLCFEAFEPALAKRLAFALRGLPPPLPAGRASVDAWGAAEGPTRLRLWDGTMCALRAEAQLLTAPRPRRAPPLANRNIEDACQLEVGRKSPILLPPAAAARLRATTVTTHARSQPGSPMTAILDGAKAPALAVPA